MEQPYQCTGAKTKFRPKLPPAQITPPYPTAYPYIDFREIKSPRNSLKSIFRKIKSPRNLLIFWRKTIVVR